ncbi:TorF family putative porin, partial [Herbaspirillum sp. 3C11]
VAHVGHQRYTGPNSSNLSYTDWKLGLNRDFSGYVLAAYYTGTNAKDAGYTVKGKNLGRDQLVLSVSRTF